MADDDVVVHRPSAAVEAAADPLVVQLPERIEVLSGLDGKQVASGRQELGQGDVVRIVVHVAHDHHLQPRIALGQGGRVVAGGLGAGAAESGGGFDAGPAGEEVADVECEHLAVQQSPHRKDIPADEIPSIPTQVEVQIITIDPVIPQEEIDEVKSELRGYIDRVQSGEVSFSTLAVLYSEDPGSARVGGDLGFFGRNQMVPEFSAVAFNMTDPAKISKIVETEYGFHILQFVERLGDRVRVRHILRKPKIPMESIDNCLARLDSVAQDIRTGKRSFENSVTTYSQDKNTRNNNGLMTFRTEWSPVTGASKVELQYLPQDVAKVVDRMHVGEISEPFVMQMDGGKTTCAIVKLKSKTNAHKANMADDYDILYEIVNTIRQQEALEKWVREKQRTTYVRISEGWGDCEFMYPGWVKR